MKFSVAMFLLVTLAVAALFVGGAYFVWGPGASRASAPSTDGDERTALRMNGDLDAALIYDDLTSS